MKKVNHMQKIMLLILLLLPLSGFSQKILTGTVKDRAGEALIGASIYAQNSNNRILVGIIANLNGEYYMTLPADTRNIRIVCSFVGYKTQTVYYKDQKTLNFVLEEEAQMMDEVSVVARVKEKGDMGVPTGDMGVARQKIDMEEMSEMQVTSVEDALQGRLGNVDIIAASGDPGSKMSIRIRGTSSLNASNEPLIVLDGIPYETDIADDFDFAAANEDDFGALVNISPNDIESIEVLKDAAATAIWGSKGANGVLVITTKRGTRGKTRFSINQKIDYKVEPKPIPMLDGKQYVTMVQDAMWNRMHDVGFHWSEMERLTKYPEINFDPDYRYFDEYNQNTNWVDEIKKNTFTSETNFSMAGGGERALYRFSVGYLSEGGTTIGTSFKRLSSRLNVDYIFSTKLKVSAGFSFTQGNRDANWKDANGNVKVRGHAMTKMPNMSPYVLDDFGQRTNEYFVPLATDDYTPFQGTWSGWVFNPVAMVNESVNNTVSRDIRVSFNLQYNVIPSLMFRSDIGFDIGAKNNKMFLPQVATGVSASSTYYNRAEKNKSDNLSMNINNKLIYDKAFTDDHRVIFSMMSQIQEQSSSKNYNVTSGIGHENMADPTNPAAIVTMESGNSKNRTVAFIFNGHYNFKERYLVNFLYRYEGNSRMGKDSRWGGFPSATATWRVSNEPFLMAYEEWLSEAQIRYSWGQSGNAPTGSYPYVGTFKTDGEYLGISAVQPSTIQLNNLKWEVVTQHNIGLDMSFLNHKLGVTFDWYNKVSKDVLQKDAKVSSVTGFNTVSYFNSGEIQNYGWEFRFDVRNMKFGDWNFSGNFNISRNRNKVLSLPVNLDYEKYSFGNGNYAQNVVEGDPLGSFYGYRYLGVYQNEDETIARDRYGNRIMDMSGNPVYTMINNIQMRPGDARYEDMNHDGVIDKNDIVYLGNSMPIVTYGFGVNVGYKNLKLKSFFQGRVGQSAINRTRINTENMYNANNQSRAVLKRWRKEGDQTDIPRALWQRGYNYLGSDRFVDDATFLRLKQLTLSYTLGKPVLRKLGLTRAEVYLTSYDLWTITKYKGQNPEVGLDGTTIYQLAVDNSDTPRPIRFALGITVDF